MKNDQKITNVSFNNIDDSIKHFEGLQKRYIKTHNGKMCLKVDDALTSMYFIKSMIKSLEKEKEGKEQMNEMCGVFEIVRLKNGLYDLYDGAGHIMFCGNINTILEYLSKESEFGPIVLEFKDKSIENNDKKIS